jgi:hypothetical protein
MLYVSFLARGIKKRNIRQVVRSYKVIHDICILSENINLICMIGKSRRTPAISKIPKQIPQYIVKSKHRFQGYFVFVFPLSRILLPFPTLRSI